MRLFHFIVAAVTLLNIASYNNSASGATTYRPSTFNGNTSTLGWTGDGPAVVANSGATGAGDGSLRAVATDGGGAGSRLAIYNTQAAWTGNYPLGSVTGLKVDMRNTVSSSRALEMRLVLFSGDSRWTSTTPFLLPKDDRWYTAFFPISSSTLTRVQGSVSYANMMTNVSRIMLRHDVNPPSAQGAPVAATVYFDNITLVPEPVAGLPVVAMVLLWLRRFKVR